MLTEVLISCFDSCWWKSEVLTKVLRNLSWVCKFRVASPKQGNEWESADSLSLFLLLLFKPVWLQTSLGKTNWEVRVRWVLKTPLKMQSNNSAIKVQQRSLHIMWVSTNWCLVARKDLTFFYFATLEDKINFSGRTKFWECSTYSKIFEIDTLGCCKIVYVDCPVMKHF
jgi:hypothetical protein